MKFYLVGGAVRDKLLHYPVKEKDWVVVGAEPEDLKRQGFIQVGSEFPVFLHPKTKEEYALARKEKKSAPGYYGFVCDFGPEVSLEEDLARRDLTINAMAMDERGQIIDPYHGQEDLKNKCLRHVSPAFVEDPVRVLRVARFAARYHHLGFRVAEETRRLMADMVRQGELAHLVPERVWKEWQRSLTEKNPEQFIEVLRACGALAVVLPELDALFGVPQTICYHPEIDSGIHSLMVLKESVLLSPEPEPRFAALLHDLGKGETPMAIWPRHHGHDQAGVPVIENLCQRLRIPKEYRQLAVLVSQLHTNIHRLFELRADTIVRVLEQGDAFRKPERFEQILLACQADSAGRLLKDKTYPQADAWRLILERCMAVDVKAIVAEGLKGEAVKVAIHQQRVDRVKEIQIEWKRNEK